MSLTGSVVANTCYASAPVAVDAYFSAIAPVTLADGSLVSYVKPWGFWDRMLVSPSGAVSYTSAVVPVFPTCDPTAGFADGVLFSSVVVVLIFLAVSFGIVARAR